MQKEKGKAYDSAKKGGCQLELIKILASEVDTVVSAVVNRLQRLHFQKYIKLVHIFHIAFLIRNEIKESFLSFSPLSKNFIKFEFCQKSMFC